MLRQMKRLVDATDADRARDIYRTPDEFVMHFSYRKGNKILPLKNSTHIARKLRKIEGNPRFWDHPDEEEAELVGC